VNFTFRAALIFLILAALAVTIGNLIALKIASDQVAGTLNQSPTGRLLGLLSGSTPRT